MYLGIAIKFSEKSLQCIYKRYEYVYNGFPFEIKLKEPNEVTYAAMEDAENGKDMYGAFDSVEALTEEVDD